MANRSSRKCQGIAWRCEIAQRGYTGASEEMTFSGTGTSKKITFGIRNKAKLSAAQLALVTDKGWVLG